MLFCDIRCSYSSIKIFRSQYAFLFIPRAARSLPCLIWLVRVHWSTSIASFWAFSCFGCLSPAAIIPERNMRYQVFKVNHLSANAHLRQKCSQYINNAQKCSILTKTAVNAHITNPMLALYYSAVSIIDNLFSKLVCFRYCRLIAVIWITSPIFQQIQAYINQSGLVVVAQADKIHWPDNWLPCQDVRSIVRYLLLKLRPSWQRRLSSMIKMVSKSTDSVFVSLAICSPNPFQSIAVGVSECCIA